MPTKKKSTKKSAALAPEEKAAEKALAPLQAQALDLRSWDEQTKLATLDEVPEADSALSLIKALLKSVDAERKDITKPLQAVIRKVNAKAKKVSEPLEHTRRHIEALLRDLEKRERAKAIKAAEKEAKKAEKRGAQQLADDLRAEAAVESVLPLEGQTTRTQKKAKVVDKKALVKAYLEGKVGDEVIDIKMPPLNAMAKAGMEPPPGVEFYTETVFADTRG